jgi:hypothetical protein
MRGAAPSREERRWRRRTERGRERRGGGGRERGRERRGSGEKMR